MDSDSHRPAKPFNYASELPYNQLNPEALHINLNPKTTKTVRRFWVYTCAFFEGLPHKGGVGKTITGSPHAYLCENPKTLSHNLLN